MIHFSRAGVPTGEVSIALRYMHSPVEMVQLDDIDRCARLIAAFAQGTERRDVVRALSAAERWASVRRRRGGHWPTEKSASRSWRE